MSDLNDDDYNGECFIVGASGESEDVLDNRIVPVAADIPWGGNNAFDSGNANHQAHLDLFFRMQYWKLVEVYGSAPPQGDGGSNPPVVDANVAARLRKVAYIRTIAAREGHFDFTGTPTQHRCKYSEFEVLDWDGVQDFARDTQNNAGLIVTDLATARAAIPRIPNVANDRAWQNGYRKKHVNVVCILAYFFRVRGHHWIEEMNTRYVEVWRKCLYPEDNVGVEWEYVAHDALHAIFPDLLDAIWNDACNNDKCAGALIKRFDTLPAGVAGISALNAGVADLQMIVPKALDYAKDAVEHLDNLTETINTERWAGSVNRRFYNAPAMVVDESKLSALAAIIRSGLENLAPGSPLLKSKALERIARNAAMTGAIVGKMVVTAVRSEAAAETFLPDIRRVEG